MTFSKSNHIEKQTHTHTRTQHTQSHTQSHTHTRAHTINISDHMDAILIKFKNHPSIERMKEITDR